MQLKDRKRINNIPRFNSGFDSNTAFKSIGEGVKNNTGTGSNLIVKDYFAKNNVNDSSFKFKNDSYENLNKEVSNMKLHKLSNSGFDSNTAFNSISEGVKDNGDIGSNLMTKEYFSKKLNTQISNMKLPHSSFKIPKQLINKGSYSVVDALGDAFSQSDKFTDSTSNDIRNYGGIISKAIPGKYGKLAGDLFDITSNAIGIHNYHHNNDQMMNEVGTTERTINGIGYTTQNDIDTAKSYSDVKNTGVKNAVSMGLKGSAAGFLVGGPIGAIAGGVLGNILGIFGGRRAAIRQGRINRNAIKQNSLINAQQKAYANSQGLVNNYYANNDDTTDDILYANRGKDLRLRKRINNKKK